MPTLPPIRPVSPHDPAARVLLQQSAALMERLYPSESNYLADANTLSHKHAIFLGGYLNEQLAGIGGAIIHTEQPAYAELKSIFVSPHARGKQIGKQLMQALETESLQRGILLMRLETGIHQAAAIKLYTQLGYRKRTPFGHYNNDPLSIFMEKRMPLDLEP